MTDPAARAPRMAVAGGVAAVSVVVLAGSWWFASRSGVPQAQAGIMRALNDPWGPIGVLLAVTNPLFRPWPLTVLSAVLVGWVLVSIRSRTGRVVVLRAGVTAFVVAEVVAQTIKRIAGEPRPLAILADLDTHGYPREPAGNAFPSAHTAVTVGLVCAVWPWMRPGQRVTGAALVVLVPLNRVYIGAHWPVDLVGGAAVGTLAAAIGWMVVAHWPTRPTGDRERPGPP
jgi:undecaprenyl-diphosphatase